MKISKTIVDMRIFKIKQKMRAKVTEKWGDHHWPAMEQIISHESGFNPYAKNKKSGACGLPQSLPCSKLTDKCGSLDNFDCQVDWVVNYVTQHGYGTPINAWNEWNKLKCAIRVNGECTMWASRFW